MRSLELAALTATFAGIAWGAARFFVPPSRKSWQAIAVTILALAGVTNQFSAVWQAGGDPIRSAFAIPMYLSSMFLFWTSVRACPCRSLRAIFDRNAPDQIMTGGPYRLIRHPFYASYMIFWAAGWVGVGNWSTALVACGMSLVYVRAAVAEEFRFLASPFGENYERYRQMTGLIVPRPSWISQGGRRKRCERSGL